MTPGRLSCCQCDPLLTVDLAAPTAGTVNLRQVTYICKCFLPRELQGVLADRDVPGELSPASGRGDRDLQHPVSDVGRYSRRAALCIDLLDNAHPRRDVTEQRI
jgi:hypothetical protein